MITNEAGAMSPKNDMLVLIFDLNVWEQDILKDIQRIILETEYHAKTEFGIVIPEPVIDNFFTYLLRLFAAQATIAPRANTKVRVKIPKSDLSKLSFIPEGFDERAVESVNDDSVLTAEERNKIDEIEMRYVPGLRVYASPN